MSVSAMDGRSLAKAIRQVGLEDAGVLLSLATPEQLRGALDEDLWRLEKPGEAERFDAERFGLFLAVLLDQGEDKAVEKLLGLDRDLLAAGFSHLVYVVERAHLMASINDERDGSLLEKAMESRANLDLDFDHVAIARVEGAWDAAIQALVALGEADHELQAWVLDRCAEVTAGLEDEWGGLYEVLNAEGSLLEDLADAREQRRSALGFVPAQDAAAFLKLAAALDPAEALTGPADDAISRAYFRALQPLKSPEPAATTVEPMAPAPLPLLPDAGEAPPEAEWMAGLSAAGPLTAELERVLREDPDEGERLLKELAFLVNAVLAAAPQKSSDRSARAAAQAALAACEKGWLYAKEKAAVGQPLSLLKLFKAGWGAA